MGYNAEYLSPVDIKIPGGNYMDTFHAGRWIETVTSGNTVTVSGAVVSGTYDYYYHNIDYSAYVIPPFNHTQIRINAEGSLDTTVESDIFYVHFGPGDGNTISGVVDPEGFPNTVNTLQLAKLKDKMAAYKDLNYISKDLGTVTAGKLQSASWNAATSGFELDLDNNELTVYEPEGLVFKEGSNLTFESSSTDYSRIYFKKGSDPARYSILRGTTNPSDIGSMGIHCTGDEYGIPVASDTFSLNGFWLMQCINNKYEFLTTAVSGCQSQIGLQGGNSTFAKVTLFADAGDTWQSSAWLTADSITGYSYIRFYGPQDYIGPNSHKSTDLARSSNAFDTAYADDFTNVADWYHMDHRIDENGQKVKIDDVAVIKSIGATDKYDEISGLNIIDDNTLPQWLLHKAKRRIVNTDDDDEVINVQEPGDIAMTEDGKPYLSLKTMISLCMGAIKQLDARLDEIERQLNR